jgi:hypothetical protein
MHSDIMFDNTSITLEEKSLKQPFTQPDQISTHRCFYVVKPLWGNNHCPNQHCHLEQFINAKENITKRFTRDFIQIDHQKMTLHAI